MKLNGYKNKMNITGELIRKYREEKGVSRDGLASKLSLTGVTLYGNDIYLIENDKRTVRDFELIAICEILGIPVNELKKEL